MQIYKNIYVLRSVSELKEERRDSVLRRERERRERERERNRKRTKERNRERRRRHDRKKVRKENLEFNIDGKTENDGRKKEIKKER